MLTETSILGVRITTTPQQPLWHYLIQQLHAEASERPIIVFTPNPEILVAARRHNTFQTVLNTADVLLPDGQGTVWASRGAIQTVVTGVDTMFALLDYANQHQLTVGVCYNPAGLSSGSAIAAALQQRYSNCQVELTTTTFTKPAPALVIVALGSPAQEQWVEHNRANLANSRVVLTVGGGIDYLTGQQIRAPLLFRTLKLEWLWRLIIQPHRFKRIWQAVVVFPWLVVQSWHK
ncbi:MAG: WecB/TagA/CpsF family glycosyltransferase [Candidatus Kerfeldbacteria bacterium]|nr:WecB/TagA/CpsF family glycosyltransferase [Candidatus Kerfeldbacteria bacterium]